MTPMYFATTETADRAKPQQTRHPRRGASPKSLTPVSRSEELGLRLYAPSLGRWISRDPVEDDVGPNPYLFVHSSPVNLLDRLGLWTITFIPSDETGMPWSIGDLSPDRGFTKAKRNYDCPCTCSRYGQTKGYWHSVCAVTVTFTIWLDLRFETDVASGALTYGHEQKHVASIRKGITDLAEEHLTALEHTYWDTKEKCKSNAETVTTQYDTAIVFYEADDQLGQHAPTGPDSPFSDHAPKGVMPQKPAEVYRGDVYQKYRDENKKQAN